MHVDCDYPGGNIIVDRIEGDTLDVRQDLRDTEGHWFYWNFRVCGASGRTLTVHFTQGHVMGAQGPAVSTNAGASWTWLGPEAVQESSFRYAVPGNVDEVRFAACVPYLEKNWKAFEAGHAENPAFESGVLCTSEKGRTVEKVRLGTLDGQARRRVMLTCRHHACESAASYALEGLLDEILSDSEAGRGLRESTEFLVVPFMDKDGVEEGDQGKNRKPYDHNRDYSGEPIYESVRALKELVLGMSGSPFRVSFDLHCPGLRGPRHECLHFVGGRDQQKWKNLTVFSKVLERVQKGPLVYHAEDNLPYGVDWNVYDGPLCSCSTWAGQTLKTEISSGLEVPYAVAREKIVTPDSARLFGRDMAVALNEYVNQAEGSQPM